LIFIVKNLKRLLVEFCCSSLILCIQFYSTIQTIRTEKS
jgi:hypothetical protein